MEFAFDQIWIWHDDQGVPGDDRERIDVSVSAVPREQIKLIKWNSDYEMMMIDFGPASGNGKSRRGWVKKADLVPPASACGGQPQSRVAERTKGSASNSVMLASRGLAEKACE